MISKTCGIFVRKNLFYRRMGENPVDVTDAMNPVTIKVVDSNERPLTQVQRNNAFYILAESTGKIPGKHSLKSTHE